jgi:hypothetical protein
MSRQRPSCGAAPPAGPGHQGGFGQLESMVLPVGRERLMRLDVAGKVARPR